MKAANTGNLTGSALTSLLMNTMKLNKVNKLYSHNFEKRNQEFLDAVLQELEIKFELDHFELNQIPKKGPFITVSNHPFGGIDGMLLMKVISMVRPDFKVFGNYLLQKIQPLEDFVIPVNPFESHKNLKSSVGGIIQANRHLANGHPLGIFPAGEVSSFNERTVQDKQWIHTAIKFIKNQNVPIVPVYFHGHNSSLFYLLGLINPMLRTAKLPSELFNKKNQKIGIRIGKPIGVEEQNEFKDSYQYGRFLRAKTYALGSVIEVKKFYKIPLKRKGRQEEIVKQFNIRMIEEEIKSLPPSNKLFSSGKYDVFCASPSMIPLTLNEIGRLREITFREVGEGTNHSIDLDEFDLYYDHLFIWDDDEKKLVGSYRIGKGQEIVRYFGKKGFYVNTLFNIDKKFNPTLEKSIELGRSFVVKEYQKKPACLFLLWKGILSVLLKHPEYRYLIGPVSISSTYSNFSKSLIIDFIKSNYFHHSYASLIKPRKKFKVKYKNVDHLIMLEHAQGDLNKLDRMIEEIEPSQYKMPILFKKYLKQNARIMGFNVDPRFNEALDGLMILDLYEVPIETLKGLSKELNDESIMDRFYSQHALEEYAKIPQL